VCKVPVSVKLGEIVKSPCMCPFNMSDIVINQDKK
jgi:hypothetical protein